MERKVLPNAAVDPSDNVFAWVGVNVERFADLRKSDEALAVERRDSIRREMDLRAEFTSRFEIAEAGRLNALLDLIRLEIKTSRESAAAIAETLRVTVENTRLALAAQVENQRKENDARVSAIERNQSAGTGKGAGAMQLWAILAAAVVLAITIAKFFGH